MVRVRIVVFCLSLQNSSPGSDINVFITSNSPLVKTKMAVMIGVTVDSKKYIVDCRKLYVKQWK